MLSSFKKISKKQAYAFNLYQRDNQVECFDGAIRVGKTFWAIGGFTKWIIDETLAGRIGLYATLAFNSRLLKINIFPYFEAWLNFFGVKYKQTGYHIEMYIGVHAIRIEGFGASNAASFASFQGITAKGIFVDEAALLNEYALKIAYDRCLIARAENSSKIILTSNPEGGNQHPYKVNYVDKYPTTSYNLLDNPVFTQSEVDEYRRILPEADFHRRIMGKWVVSSGAVYEHSPIKIKRSDLPKIDYIYVGVDEGRGDAFTGVAVGFSKKTMAYYIIDQYYSKTEKMINNVWNVHNFSRDLANEFGIKVAIVGETNPGITYDTLYDDPNVDKNLMIFKVRKKIKNKEYKGKSAIQERIDLTNGLMFSDMLYICDNVKQLSVAFENAVYKNGARLDDGTSDIDSLDAFEYAISRDMTTIYRMVYKNVNAKVHEKIGKGRNNK